MMVMGILKDGQGKSYYENGKIEYDGDWKEYDADKEKNIMVK